MRVFRGVLVVAVTNAAFALMLATARRLTEVENYIRTGQWKRWHLKQLLGVDAVLVLLGAFGLVALALAAIGLGRIGSPVAASELWKYADHPDLDFRSQINCTLTHGLICHCLLNSIGKPLSAKFLSRNRFRPLEKKQGPRKLREPCVFSFH